MSYTRPTGNGVVGVFGGTYTRPAGSSANGSFAPDVVRLTDLVFSQVTTASADLLFGATDGQQAVSATISGSFEPLGVAIAVKPQPVVFINGTFTPLQANVQVSQLFFGEISGTFPPLVAEVHVMHVVAINVAVGFAPLSAAISAVYSSNTARPTVSQSDTAWQQAIPTEDGTTQPQSVASKAPEGWEAFWQKTIGESAPIYHVLPDVLHPFPTDQTSTFQDATPLHSQGDFSHDDATRIKLSLDTLFQDASKVRDSTLFKHQDGDKLKRAGREGKWKNATVLRASRGSSMQSATVFNNYRGSRFQDARKPPAGISSSSVVPPVVPETHNGDLLFSWPFGYNGTNLVFVHGDYTVVAPPTESVVVPVRRVYIVLNTVYLRRASDNTEIPTFSMSMNIDVSSWTWGWNASIPATARSLVESSTAPVELKAIVNGTEYRLLAERIAQDRKFGEARLAISGRGKNAVLDSPYAPKTNFANTIDRTAQQLMNDALTVNNVSIGWAVDWGITDWLVPAGVWSHQGSYISALKTIAGSAGGYLAPHPTANTVRVRHLYPTAPWQWAGVTPDFILPPDVVTQEAMEWINKAAYNRVYVSGQGQGVLGQVTLTGSAGDLLAPMVVDPLITHADAARQRGIAILGDTGKQLSVNLRLPVLAETGIIEPGKFVQYSDGSTTHRGLVRSTNVAVGSPEVWQTLEVETHVA